MDADNVKLRATPLVAQTGCNGDNPATARSWRRKGVMLNRRYETSWTCCTLTLTRQVLVLESADGRRHESQLQGILPLSLVAHTFSSVDARKIPLRMCKSRARISDMQGDRIHTHLGRCRARAMLRIGAL